MDAVDTLHRMGGEPAAAADNKATSMRVGVEATLQVPLLMPILDSIDDPMLRKEIAEEAVRVSVVERLGGFEGVSVREVPPQRSGGGAATTVSYVANIDFDALCRCIHSIQAEYDRVCGLSQCVDDVVKQMRSAAGERSDGDGVAETSLAALEEAVSAMQCRPVSDPAIATFDAPRANGGMPQLVPSDNASDHDDQEARRNLLDDNDSESDGGFDAYGGDPAAAGYTRMADD